MKLTGILDTILDKTHRQVSITTPETVGISVEITVEITAETAAGTATEIAVKKRKLMDANPAK
jgi:hypothetical protein